MAITALDHIYVETHDWSASSAFWEGLGFEFQDRWGGDGHRAGRLQAGSANVVLAEVAGDQETAFNVFFDLEDADDFDPSTRVDVSTGLSDTHWGTRWIRVRDPEGRTFCLEEASGG